MWPSVFVIVNNDDVSKNVRQPLLSDGELFISIECLMRLISSFFDVLCEKKKIRIELNTTQLNST